MRMHDWDSLVRKVARDDADKHDHQYRLVDLTFANGEVITPTPSGYEGGERYRHFEVSDYARSQLCARLGVPTAFWSDVASTNPVLADAVLNDAAQRANARHSEKHGAPMETLLRFKGQRVRAALSDTYSRIDNATVLEMLDSVKGTAPMSLRSVGLNDHGMWLKATFDDLSRPDPSPGGMRRDLKVGVLIGNAETGSRLFTSEGFVFRAACTNDKVVVTRGDRKQEQRHSFVTPEAVRLLLERSIAYAQRTGMAAIDNFLAQRNKKVVKPRAVIEAISLRGKLGERVKKLALAAYDIEPEDNLFGIVNAFTRAAQGVVDVDARITLERFAGGLEYAEDDFFAAAA